MQSSLIDQKYLRWPAWMLALSVAPYIATVATGVIGFIVTGDLPLGVTFNEITPQIMSEIWVAWLLLNLFVFIATLNISLGSILIARNIKDPAARPWMFASLVLNAVIILFSLGNMLARWSVINFNEATLAENGVYAFTNTLSIFYALPFLAMLMLCTGLVVSGALLKTGLVVGVVCALFFVLALFPEISRSMPPFIFGFVAMPVGIGLLLKGRREAQNTLTAVPGM
jgi:hypothetical protein